MVPAAIGFSIVVLCLIPTQDSVAAIYKYVDKSGTVCFVDRLQAIPEEYRKSAVEVVNESGDVKKHPPEGGLDEKKASKAERREEFPGREKMRDITRNVSENKMVRVVGAILGFLFIFMLTGKISAALDRKQVGAVLRILLTVGVLTYLFHLHSSEIANVFTSLREEVFGVTAQVDERNKKTEELLKEPAGGERP